MKLILETTSKIKDIIKLESLRYMRRRTRSRDEYDQIEKQLVAFKNSLEQKRHH